LNRAARRAFPEFTERSLGTKDGAASCTIAGAASRLVAEADGVGVAIQKIQNNQRLFS
jgi:hypothetical protein